MSKNLVAENWRLEQSRYAIVGIHCKKCDAFLFPKMALCSKCHEAENIEEYFFSNKGTLIQWTIIHAATRGFEISTPYYYGIVELEHGVKVSTQITGVNESKKLKKGMPIEMVFRKLFEDGNQGILTYGFKAQPIY